MTPYPNMDIRRVVTDLDRRCTNLERVIWLQMFVLLGLLVGAFVQ